MKCQILGDPYRGKAKELKNLVYEFNACISNRHDKKQETRQHDLRVQQTVIESESRRYMEVWCQYNEERVKLFQWLATSPTLLFFPSRN